MSATMTRQEGRVQLEKSDMHLAFNVEKMDKEGFLWTAIEDMQFPDQETSRERL
jgi:hypothetical protein